MQRNEKGADLPRSTAITKRGVPIIGTILVAPKYILRTVRTVRSMSLGDSF